MQVRQLKISAAKEYLIENEKDVLAAKVRSRKLPSIGYGGNLFCAYDEKFYPSLITTIIQGIQKQKINCDDGDN